VEIVSTGGDRRGPDPTPLRQHVAAALDRTSGEPKPPADMVKRTDATADLDESGTWTILRSNAGGRSCHPLREGTKGIEMPRNPRNPRHLQIDLIRTDGGTQAREQMNEEAIAEYADLMANNVDFPPLSVVDDGQTLWLADGFHRLEAAKRNGATRVLANVERGTMVDAILAAAASNAGHGVRRTNADKKRAVAMVLSLPGYSDKSDREIARLCAVTHPFVAACRRQEEREEEQETETASEGEDATSSVQDAMHDAKNSLTYLRDLFKTAKEELAEIAGSPHGIFLNLDAISADLSNAIAAVNGAMPARECPVCHGEGCRTCRESGWVSRLVNDHAIPNMEGAE